MKYLALALLLSMPLAAQSPRVPVYVTSVGAKSGMTDPSKDNRDTVKNLVDKIKGKHDLELVQRPEDAAIVLTVLGREVSPESSNIWTGAPARDKTVRVKFEAGELATELTATASNNSLGMDAGRWTQAAGKIVDQVVVWVKENPSRLAAR